METYGNIWKNMETYGKLWKQYAIIRNHMEYYAMICKNIVNTQYGKILEKYANI